MKLLADHTPLCDLLAICSQLRSVALELGYNVWLHRATCQPILKKLNGHVVLEDTEDKYTYKQYHYRGEEETTREKKTKVVDREGIWG